MQGTFGGRGVLQGQDSSFQMSIIWKQSKDFVFSSKDGQIES